MDAELPENRESLIDTELSEKEALMMLNYLKIEKL